MAVLGSISYGKVDYPAEISSTNQQGSESTKQQFEFNLKGQVPPTRIALPDKDSLIFVDINSIIRCESSEGFSTIYTKDGSKYSCGKSIREYEQLFATFYFFRIHNMHLVNLNYIKRYFKGRGGYIEMEDGSVIEVANRRKDDFLAYFNA